MNALRVTLRDRTSEAHSKLDKALIVYDLSQLSGLTSYLKIHYLARQHLTKLLSGLDELRDEAERLEDLSKDLSALGAPLPNWSQPPDMSPQHPLGLIYVMAGSSLGSKLLYKQWDTSHDPLVKRADRFVTHAKNNDIWTRFLAYLDSHEFSSEETEHIIASANYCFSVFEAAHKDVKA